MPSSVISSYHYDPGTKVLQVKYQSGTIYNYLDVPEETYREMKSTMSKGYFLNKFIKGKFRFERTEKAEPGHLKLL